MHIKDTAYFQFKEANVKAFRLWREIKKIIESFLLPIIDKLNHLLLIVSK